MERLPMNVLMDVVHRLRAGEGVRGIARDLSLSRNTVRKYRELCLPKGYLDPQSTAPRPEEVEAHLTAGLSGRAGRPPGVGAGAWLGEHRGLVESFLKAGVEVQTIHERLVAEHKYPGSCSTLRRFVASIQCREPDVFCRVETKPGEEAQVDFGYAGVVSGRKVWVFVMTLGWSRHQYIEFVHDQKIETWIGCHERAFAFFGGVPGRVVIDNLKAAVTSHKVHDPVLGEPYRRLARHYGFMVSANRPRTPRHKGKVESGVHYVKRSLLAGRTFTDLAAMNEAGLCWVREKAGTRLHGTTKEPPLGRFTEVEKASLGVLPSEDFEWVSAMQCRVGADCHVTVEGSYYSVPYRHSGRQVDVYIGRRIVEIYDGTTLLVTHERATDRGQRLTRPDHYPEGKRHWLENTPDRCRERARAVGQACGQLVCEQLSDRVLDRLSGIQSLLRLGEKHGNDRLEAACRRALHHGEGTYRRVKAILAAGLDAFPLEDHGEARVIDMTDYCFARDPKSFFEGGRR